MAAETLGFEAKVQGLIDYYQALRGLDPSDSDHSDVANPDFFYYADGYHASKPLQEAKQGVIFDIECHAAAEYGRRGFNSKDLRDDSTDELAERADLLAVTSAPMSPGEREERGRLIAGVLMNVASGRTVNFSTHRRSPEPQEFAVDTSRALYGILDGHISNRTVTFLYDSPTVVGDPDRDLLGSWVGNFDVPAFVDGDLRVTTQSGLGQLALN